MSETIKYGIAAGVYFLIVFILIQIVPIQNIFIGVFISLFIITMIIISLFIICGIKEDVIDPIERWILRRRNK